ncbi:MAG TPA: DUF6519 domain-containing protein, partial [Thermoanaerobaculia bacterium]
ATNVDLTKNPRLRLWQSGETQLGNGAFVVLEDGVEVRFEAGNYRTGDSWTIPARTAISDETGHIEWPTDGVGNALALPAEAIVHHFAPLATIDATGKVTHDCRPLFAPITAPDLFYLAGDGQEVSLADPRLPQNLEVLVSNGAPVAGAKVEFRVTNGAGNVSTVADTNPGNTLVVTTGVDGKAACIWRTDLTAIRQTVTARLIELEAKDYVPELPPIAFNAWIKYAKNVVYEPGGCSFLDGTRTVQEALDKLCNRPSDGGICTLVLTPEMDWPKMILDLPQDRDTEICFGVGVFQLAETLRLGGRRRLTLNGTGKGSRIVGKGIGELVVFEGSRDVIVRDLSFESDEVPPPQETITDLALPGVVAVLKSTDALFEDVRFRCGERAEKAIACLVFNTMTTEARVSRCEFEVGSEQVGIVAQRASTVQIESCRFTGPSRSRIEDLPVSALRELLPELAFAPTDRHNVTLKFETERVAFRVSEAEAREWNRFPPTAIVPAGTEPQEVLPTLTRFIARLPAGDFPIAARRIEPIVARLTATRAGEALVVVRSGTAVSVRDNVIAKFARGILLGAHYVNDERIIDANVRVFVVDNTVLLTLGIDRDTKTEHGIDIGSCRHSTVRGNHVEADRVATGDIFGISIEGDLGVFSVVRDNQVMNVRFGFNAFGTNGGGVEDRRWLLVDNVAHLVLKPVTEQTNFQDNTLQTN